MKKRYIHVYTGNGKGKTTASMGLLLRALGAGFRVAFCQFMKNGQYAEIKSLEALKLQYPRMLSSYQFGAGEFVRGNPSEQEKIDAQRGIEKVELLLRERDLDLLILDEVNVAVFMNLIPENTVLAWMEQKPETMEMVLTGRGATEAMKQKADLVTEMKEIKHYFTNGVSARKGIEF